MNWVGGFEETARWKPTTYELGLKWPIRRRVFVRALDTAKEGIVQVENLSLGNICRWIRGKNLRKDGHGIYLRQVLNLVSGHRR